MQSIDLTGKVAFVTGGSQGIGESIARTLHSAGAKVAINYFADEEGANQRKAGAIVESLKERSIAVAGDVRSPEQIAGAIEETNNTFGGLDILVNNAGILRDRTLKKMSETEWQDVIDTNDVTHDEIVKHWANTVKHRPCGHELKRE